MSWLKLSLDTTHEGVDWVCTLLATAEPIDEVQIANFSGEEWAFTICLYLINDARANAAIYTIETLLSPLQRTQLISEIEITEVEEKSPSHALRYRVGDRFVVVSPDFKSDPSPNDIVLKLRSTLSFGSGLHPATMLSLRLLERYVVPKMNALDLGSGSGILSVAMAKLGTQVLAIDNDVMAVKATQEAVDLNQVADRVTVQVGSLGCGSDMGHWMGGDTSEKTPAIEATARFDLIAANILGRIHIALAPEYRQALVSSGLLITSGFTTDYEAEIQAAFDAAGFESVDRETFHEWVALVHRVKMA